MALLAGIAGCSKATQSDPKPPPPQSSRIVIGGGETVTLPTGAEAVVARSIITAPLTDVWNVLPSVYADLGIAVEMVNPTEYRIGNQALRARRRIGQLQMIRLLSCGGTIGAPNAETFDITMYVVSQVSAGQAGTSSLATVVQAVGKSPNFGGNNVSCASLGALEKRIEELVRAKVKK